MQVPLGGDREKKEQEGFKRLTRIERYRGMISYSQNQITLCSSDLAACLLENMATWCKCTSTQGKPNISRTYRDNNKNYDDDDYGNNNKNISGNNDD